ncbi:MAG: hypothetical protein Q8Q39_00365, partial [bacterium]|nr:hypothetical protein [bacterium]
MKGWDFALLLLLKENISGGVPAAAHLGFNGSPAAENHFINMEIIFNEIFRALGYLLIAGAALVAYNIARDNVKDGKFKMILLKGFLWCG